MEEKLSKLEISIVIPVFNEAENIHFLSKEITKSLKNFRHEIIFVDDGSSDDTRKEIKSIANELNQIRLLSHKKSLGQSVAMRSGIIHSKSNLIATLDGDGQNVPSDLPSMISTYKNNKDGLVLVAGIRQNRKDSLSKRLASKTAKYIRSIILGDNHPDSGCGIRVFDKNLFLLMPFFNHMHRFITVLASKQGAKVIGVPVKHRERLKGYSKYTNLGRAFVGIFDIIGVIWLNRRTPVKFEVEEQNLRKGK